MFQDQFLVGGAHVQVRRNWVAQVPQELKLCDRSGLHAMGFAVGAAHHQRQCVGA